MKSAPLPVACLDLAFVAIALAALVFMV